MDKIHYRTIVVDGIDLFYREAGDPDRPTLLMLHGFPTSSHMFRDLIPILADRFHLIAPDYPGFGGSACPDPATFDYSFDHLGDVLCGFVDALGLRRYALYLQDFGGPVGLRLAVRYPQRVTALSVQNANAYLEGVTDELTAVLTRLHDERSDEMRAFAAPLFELPYTMRQYLEGVADPALVSPDAWNHAQWGMDRPGNKAIQYLLHADYAANFARYDAWHAYFRERQPPTLVIWGEGDFVFGVDGARAYARDLPEAELHVIGDAAHFALETHAAEIAAWIVGFMGRRVADRGALKDSEPELRT